MNMNNMNMSDMNMNATGDMPGMNSSGGMTGMPGMGSGMSGTGDGMSGMGGMGGMSGMGGMDGNMSGMSACGMMMMMYFHAGSTEYILFKDLCTNSDGAFAGACIAVFVLAILYELLKFWREQLQRQYIFRVAHIMREGTPEEKGQITSAVYRMMSGPHLLQTILHAVQIFISYCLMLIFMTYNAYLALCVVLGAAFGYFLVGWKRTQITDSNEHCH